ncbi:hypothetical protein [Gordonia caeni]|uniref:HNH endonuclease n=1 Tax=Gordonia caeni TaxID=1007097 RepID=A0ABP7PCZ3_9ACTN
MHSDPARNPDGAPLEADHSKARAIHGHKNNPADRLLHHRCNRQRGAGTRDHQRPALAGHTDTPAGDLGHLAMPWP